MNFQYIFPTCICNDVIPQDENERLKLLAVEYLNVYGYNYNHSLTHTTTLNSSSIDSVLSADVRFDYIKSYINTAVSDYLSYQNVDASEYDLETYITFNKMGQNTVLPLHAHPSCLLSGIIYLQVTSYSPPITFQDPRPYHNFKTYKQLDYKNTPCLYPIYNIKPSNGMFLMWPAWLNHEVPLNVTEDERITLVFNVQEKNANLRIS